MTKHWWRRTAQPGPGEAGWEAGADAVPPSLVAWAEVVDVSRLSEKTVQEIERYLRKYRTMTLSISQELGFRLIGAVEAQVSPPPPETAFPLDVLATVLTVRRKQLGIGCANLERNGGP